MLADFKENRKKIEFYNRNTEVLKRILDRHADDKKLGSELMKNRIKHVLVTNSVVIHHDKNIGKTTERVVKNYDQMYGMTSGSYPLFKEKWNL